MTIQEAIEARHSVRVYKEQPLAAEVVKALEEKITELNREGHLHMQLILNEPKAFQGTLAKYGKFRGVNNYIVMAGKKADDLEERIGYYGEQLVLMAQTLGLNTCWVGLSYSKVPGTYVLEDGEKIACYIAVGYGETQGVGHKVKTVEQVSNASDTTPSWFKKGVEAALLAPTAVNQQKFSFEYVGMKDGHHQVRAKKGFSMIGYTKTDLGIAKCHFEVGAGKENFEWV
ncbi:MAG: nitroreductase [Prevotella sp.]|nr:nitroreductase [Prevotella sp.]